MYITFSRILVGFRSCQAGRWDLSKFFQHWKW